MNNIFGYQNVSSRRLATIHNSQHSIINCTQYRCTKLRARTRETIAVITFNKKKKVKKYKLSRPNKKEIIFVTA